MGDTEEQDDNVYDYDPDEPVYPYGALDKWDWKPLFIETTDLAPLYPNLIDGYFRSSQILIKSIVEGESSAWSEGITATFIFRHYLELSLKFPSTLGRVIRNDGTNVGLEEVKPVGRIHHLDKLWELVIEDVKPRVNWLEMSAILILWNDAFLSSTRLTTRVLPIGMRVTRSSSTQWTLSSFSQSWSTCKKCSAS